MMSAEWADQPAKQAADGIPGTTLAAQREAMGWTVEQVAEQLKLAVRQVKALEVGDYAALPGPAVVRGFIRAYAKILKLDAAPLVAMIALETPEPGDATATTVKRERPTTFSEVRFPTHGRRRGLPLVPIAVAVAVVAAAALAWQFGLIPAQLLHGVGGDSVASAPAGVAELPAPQAPVVTPPAKLETTVQAADTVAAPAPAPEAAAPAPVTPAPVADAAPAAASAGANALVLTVKADSWIDVRGAHGVALMSKLVRAGSTETLAINEPVTLKVGNRHGVTATLRGAALELPATAGSTISRVTIK
jgi:cytoskeleton protein RodZ